MPGPDVYLFFRRHESSTRRHESGTTALLLLRVVLLSLRVVLSLGDSPYDPPFFNDYTVTLAMKALPVAKEALPVAVESVCRRLGI